MPFGKYKTVVQYSLPRFIIFNNVVQLSFIIQIVRGCETVLSDENSE